MEHGLHNITGSSSSTMASSSNTDDSSSNIFNNLNKSYLNVSGLRLNSKTKNHSLRENLLSNEDNDNSINRMPTNTLPLVVADVIARIFYMSIKWAKTLPPFLVLNSNDQVSLNNFKCNKFKIF